MSQLPSAPEDLVSRWIDAFNLRDLDGMLGCMSAEVRFYPLRLAGLERYYSGHDGVRDWFDHMDEHGHEHRIALHKIRGEPDGEVVAIGELRLDDGDSESSRFWARDRVDGGEIVVAHHYLTDPDVFDDVQRRPPPRRPPRFPGLQ